MPDLDTKALAVSCHCGAATHTFSVPISALPLPTHLCSCDISRRISGSLLTSYINITHPTASAPAPPKPDTSALTEYHTSDILKRWFCTSCGTHMYLEYYSDGHFEAATGTLTCESTDGIVEYKSCMWIGDTKDGGASHFISQINGRELPRWIEEAGESEQVARNWQSRSQTQTQTHTQQQEQEQEQEQPRKPIHAHCHCAGVKFYIQHPTPASKTAASPFADLLIPHYLNRSANPSNTPWWLPNSESRYLAGTCTCHSCRRSLGFDITFWAFIPVANIFLDSDLRTPFPAAGVWGTMKTYASSTGVTRSFCGTCGANVLWSGSRETHGREGLVDVAVGLLDAESGARAEEVLGWWAERVSFAEEAVNKGLVKALERGLREWAEVKGGGDGVARFSEGRFEGMVEKGR